MTYSEEPVPAIPGAKVFKVGELYMRTYSERSTRISYLYS